MMKIKKNKIFVSMICFSGGIVFCFILLLLDFFYRPDSSGMSFGKRLFVFFVQPWSSGFYIGNSFNTFFLFLLSGLAALFPLITGSINIGGEGQVYTGGLLTAVLLTHIPLSNSFLGLLITCILVILVTGFIGLISGILKESLDLPEILSTYLISLILIYLCDYLIIGPFKSSGNLIATEHIPEIFRFGKIFPPSSLNYSLIFIILIYVFALIFFYVTSKGRQFLIVGKSRPFSELQGFRPENVVKTSLFVSAALYGMVGFFAVTGTYYTCYQGFYSSLGWNGLSTALLGGINIWGLIPAALIFSCLKVGIENTALFGVLNFDTGYLVQGVVLLLLSLGYYKKSEESGQSSEKDKKKKSKFWIWE